MAISGFSWNTWTFSQVVSSSGTGGQIWFGQTRGSPNQRPASHVAPRVSSHRQSNGPHRVPPRFRRRPHRRQAAAAGRPGLGAALRGGRGHPGVAGGRRGRLARRCLAPGARRGHRDRPDQLVRRRRLPGLPRGRHRRGAEDARRRRGGAPAGARAGGRAPHEVMRATFWNFASCFVLDLIHAISCLNGNPCARSSSSPHRISTERGSFFRLSIVHSSIIEALCIQISDTHV